MFSFCMMQGLPSNTLIYFLQYYLQDVVGHSAHRFDLTLVHWHDGQLSTWQWDAT